ncbi:hypothetical protein SLE2022_227410 [Rubroshorea leprosula]
MQRNRGGGDPFSNFGDPFGGFGGFGSFGGPRSLMSGFFGGRDPFDDPFFTRPFGGMFESGFFRPMGSPFTDMHPPAFIEDRPLEPKKSRGPIIEELNSDEEKEEGGKEKNENPRKHPRSSNEPYVEDPDDAAEEKRNKLLQYRNEHNRLYDNQQQPQTRSFTFQSSTVTYGGANGAYYTSSKTRRMGSDGITFEESKEADTATRQATHRVSRGIHSKGHSLTRKLNSDGRVDTMQTLHNLNQDELPHFEETWNGSAQRHLPGWSGNFGQRETIGAGSSGQNAGRGGWALPAAEGFQQSGGVVPDRRQNAGPSHSQRSTRTQGAAVSTELTLLVV